MRRILILNTFLFLIVIFSYSQTREIVSMQLNKPMTSEIGEAAVSTGWIIRNEAIKIVETFEVKQLVKFSHTAGDVYPLVYVKKGFKIFFLEKNIKDGRYWGIGVNANNPNEAYPILASPIGLVYKMKKYKVQDKVKPTDYISLCDDCYRQEFIYSGRIGNTIKFEYREFIGDLARPSFFQNLEYDISDSNIIGFKGLRLKILKTTNTSIDFEIIEPFKPLR